MQVGDQNPSPYKQAAANDLHDKLDMIIHTLQIVKYADKMQQSDGAIDIGQWQRILAYRLR